jgi:hypothetical protein
MKKRRKVNTKIKSSPATVRKDDDVYVPPFHECFPFTLHLLNDKEKRVCYFVCEEHMKSYIKRYKLKTKEIKIEGTTPRASNEECE